MPRSTHSLDTRSMFEAFQSVMCAVSSVALFGIPQKWTESSHELASELRLGIHPAKSEGCVGRASPRGRHPDYAPTAARRRCVYLSRLHEHSSTGDAVAHRVSQHGFPLGIS